MTSSDDDALADLAAQVAELRRDVEQFSSVRQQLRQITEVVAELRAGLEALAATPSARPAPVWVWPELDAAAAEVAWAALSGWMRDTLFSRYPEAGRLLYACWYRHPDVLDALTALYGTWQAAYGGAGTPADAAAWLERWLPAGLRQIREGLRSCQRDVHNAPAAAAATVAGQLLGADFTSHVAIDLAARVPPAAPGS
jgi:hypothetical protein